MQFPRRVLLTGARGFVGRHLTAVLGQRFPGVVLVAEWFDVTDPDATLRAVRDAAPDSCIHLAGITAVPDAQKRGDAAWQVNLHGTLNLARAILSAAPQSRFLHVSTSEVYGRSFIDGRALDETAALAPMNTYAATKAAADLAVGAMVSDGLRAVRLRPFNHVGPGQSDAFVVAALAHQLTRVEAGLQAPVLQVGALTPRRDFLDVRDVCAAYASCLEQTDAALPAGSVLNIASGVARSIGDVLARMCEIMDLKVELVTDPQRLRPVEIAVAQGDAGRARALLGWKPLYSWDQTLHDVIADWRGRI
nr:GDP-mannose 4,6-dehydratase [uncultured Rhodopila sp.]